MKNYISTIIAVTLLSGCATTDKTAPEATNTSQIKYDYVTFPISTDVSHGGKLIKEKWYALEGTSGKQIEDLLVLDHGLSSTGSIEVIGCYDLKKSSELGDEGDTIFHVI